MHVSAHFRSSVEAGRLARQACAPLLEVAGERGDDLELLVTELVTNSVRHAPGDGETSIRLEVIVDAEHARVEVADRGAGFRRPRPTAPAVPSAGGWGLFLVDRLCDDWGVFEDGGTHVWARLPLGPPRRGRGEPALAG